MTTVITDNLNDPYTSHIPSNLSSYIIAKNSLLDDVLKSKTSIPEFEKHKSECRFSNCMHNKEPNCRVKAAVEDNEIYRDRYKFYIKTLEEIISRGIKK